MNDVDFAEEIERQNQHHYDTTGTVVVEEEQVEKPDNPYANKDIFGGDSDLSDIEEDDDVAERSRSSSPLGSNQQKRRAASQDLSDSSEDEEEEEEEDSGDEADDFVPANDLDSRDKGKNTVREGAKKKGGRAKPSKKQKGETDDGGAKRKPTKLNNQRRASGEPEANQEEGAPKISVRKDLNARIDELVKKPKSKASNRKKRTGDDDDLELMNDGDVAKLIKKMEEAAASDVTDSVLGKPAVHKLRLLPEVVAMMQKTSMAESLVENGMMKPVTVWLTPMKNKSFPALVIQRSLFEILPVLNVDTYALKASGLGKIVYYYTKNPTVSSSIARIANQLVINWMRPIIKRSKELYERDFETSAILPSSRRREERATASVGKVIASSGDIGGIARRHARVPDAMTETFTVSPAMEGNRGDRSGGGGGIGVSIGGSSTKFKDFKKRLVAGQQASRRV